MTKEESVLRIPTPRGVFFIDPRHDKKMAEALKGDTYLNDGILAVARTFVHEKSVVVDIGAHIGTFSIPAASMAGKVIAFEPSHEAFPLLVRNAQENNVAIQVVNKALGSEAGSGTLVVRNTANAGANTLVAGGDIPVATLDSEVEHTDFIKMDVEGMELEVLRGGTRLIERARPVVLFEVNLSQLRAHDTSPRALEQFFTKRGYRLYIPLEDGSGALARVHSATLMTACIAPRAWLFFGESAPFDLVAVPKERPLPLPIERFGTVLLRVLKNNLAMKVRRVREASCIYVHED